MNTDTRYCIARLIVRRLGLNLLVIATLAAVVMLSLAGQTTEQTIRPAAEGAAATLVAEHQCGDTVQDPTHAVVTVDGVTRYVGPRLTDQAIEQAVFGVDHELTVHGFCA